MCKRYTRYEPHLEELEIGFIYLTNKFSFINSIRILR
jgi:hypothetical protein